MIYLDTETCGLTGPAVLIQYAYDDGPVTLHEIWNEPVERTLELCKRICNDTVCGFNLTYDWFHINKLYNLLSCVKDRTRKPEIEEVAELRSPTTFCLKPKSALDLFLHASKGTWQSLLDRKDIRVKRVPIQVAQLLAKKLRDKIDIPNLFFHYRANSYQWIIDYSLDPSFPDLVLRFAPSSGLKPLCSELFKQKFLDFPLPADKYPAENGWNPYSTDWKYVIDYHIKFWHNNKTGRSYAEQDIILLQKLYHYFAEPAVGDIDSELACCIGAVRWKGYSIDTDGIRQRIEQYNSSPRLPINHASHIETRKYLQEVATPTERICITNTTAKTLSRLSRFNSEVGVRARQIIEARRIEKKINVLNKLLRVGRFCPDFKIIGTRSGRMAGTGGLNAQGIQHDKEFRQLFTLANDFNILSGGDFISFEVVLADAAYQDERLHADLESGKSFHALLGQALYDLPYDHFITDTGEKTALYNPSKTSAFALLYGAMPQKLAETAGISKEQAEFSYKDFIKKYPRVGIARQIVFDAFCSIRQPSGIGGMVEWHEPADYIESLLGFRRYFTLENRIVRALYDLTQELGDEFSIERKIIRRDKEQTVRGATQSALYAAAFQIQAHNMRAAANHVIQSTGAEITKNLQHVIWQIQPVGVNVWFVQPMNVHDEVMVVHDKRIDLKLIVDAIIEKYKKLVPLIKIDWKTNMKDWSDK